MDNTPPEPFDGLTTATGGPVEPFTYDKLCETIAKLTDRFDAEKKMIEALYAMNFRVIIGGSRTDLPAAILPASYAKAHAEVMEDARKAANEPTPSLFNFFNGNLMS